MEDAGLIIFLWFLFPILGAIIGYKKGRGILGFSLGLLLGVIGLIIILILQPVNKVYEDLNIPISSQLTNRLTQKIKVRCSNCNSLIDESSLYCQNCGNKMTGTPISKDNFVKKDENFIKPKLICPYCKSKIYEIIISGGDYKCPNCGKYF